MGTEASDFYSSAAQIIPVLYLALAFQTQGAPFVNDQLAQLLTWTTAQVQVARSLLAVVLTATLAAGEAAAFYGMANSAPLAFTSGHTSTIVAWSMAIGGAAVIALPIVQALTPVLLALVPDTTGAHMNRVRAGLVLAVVSLVLYLVWSTLQALIN